MIVYMYILYIYVKLLYSDIVNHVAKSLRLTEPDSINC